MKDYKDIDGFFDFQKTYEFLLSKVPDDGIFVECGAWLGCSTSFLCDKAKDRVQIFVVDTWKGTENELDTHHKLAKDKDIYKLFLENMGNRNFTPIRKKSLDAAEDFEDASCDVVFIDMDHRYEEVLKDIDAWLPKVKDGGYLAGHDYLPFLGMGTLKTPTTVAEAVYERFGDNIMRMDRSSWIYSL